MMISSSSFILLFPSFLKEMVSAMESSGLKPGTASDEAYGVIRSESFFYGIGISAGGLIFMIVITLAASYFCTKSNSRLPSPPELPPFMAEIVVEYVEGTVTVEHGKIKGYPRSGRTDDDDGTCTCCSICLSEYISSDMVRLLDGCGHFFHRDCLDLWLHRHPSCPVCRSALSPVPNPSGQNSPLGFNDGIDSLTVELL